MCEHNRIPFPKVRLHTTTKTAVDNCSLFSLAMILRFEKGVEENLKIVDHIYSYLPIYNIRCAPFV